MDVMKLVNKTVNNFSKYNNQRVDASWIRIIFIALKKEKFPAEQIFSVIGINAERLKEQEFVSQKTVHQLYDAINQYNALNSLPIYVANVFQFHFLRHIGSILTDSKTIDDLLNKIVFVTSKLSHLAKADISTDAKYCKLSLSSTTTTSKLHPITLITGICLIIKIVRQIYPHATDVIVNVILCKEASTSSLTEHLGCPVITSEDGSNSIVFDRNLLNLTNVFSTRSINISKAILDNNSKSDLNIYSEVEQLILKNITLSPVTIVEISQHMNMSVKTLQRLLSRFNTNFSELVQLNKIRLALFHLKENQLTIQQISFALGFTSPSSFSRAFKKWTGESPSQFQKNEE